MQAVSKFSDLSPEFLNTWFNPIQPRPLWLFPTLKDVRLLLDRSVVSNAVLDKTVKVDGTCDVMSWTVGSKESMNVLCVVKYLSKSFETLETQSRRHCANIWIPFNGFHKIKYNSIITCQNQLKFLD